MPFDAAGFELAPAVAAPVVETEVQRVIREARELIATQGWTQGTNGNAYEGMSDPCGPVCIGIALDRARPQLDERWRAAYRALEAAADAPYIIGWNDEPERTLAEVNAAFDRAYELAALPSSPGVP